MDLPRIAFNRCKLISKLVHNKSVLDIGCIEHTIENRKKGHWLHDYIRKSAASVLGLDYESEQIELLQKEGYNVVYGDATNFHLNRTFDIIVAGEILEHLSNPEGFFRCVYEHLAHDGKNRGLLLLTTPNANSLIYFFENLILGREIDNPDHVVLYSPTTMRTLLGRFNFEVVHFTFLAENTAYCHSRPISKLLANIKQFFQVIIGFLRPSMCHHVLTIAQPLPPSDANI